MVNEAYQCCIGGRSCRSGIRVSTHGCGFTTEGAFIVVRNTNIRNHEIRVVFKLQSFGAVYETDGFADAVGLIFLYSQNVGCLGIPVSDSLAGSVEIVVVAFQCPVGQIDKQRILVLVVEGNDLVAVYIKVRSFCCR